MNKKINKQIYKLNSEQFSTISFFFNVFFEGGGCVPISYIYFCLLLKYFFSHTKMTHEERVQVTFNRLSS